MRKPTYRAPRTAAEHIAEADQAIARLETTLYTGFNRYGPYGDNCRDSIKRWQASRAKWMNVVADFKGTEP